MRKLILPFFAVILVVGSIALSKAGLKPAPTGAAATVRFYWSTDCPIALKYTERVNKLVEEFSGQGVQFTMLFPNELETRAGVEQYLKETSHSVEWKLDPLGKSAKADGIVQVPTVVVLDANQKLVYRGAIDDAPMGDNIKRQYLKDVLSDLTLGRARKFQETETQGCFLMPGPQPPTASKVSFAEHVAPIIYKHCANCHAPGQVAPFSLRSYDEVRKWSKNIVRAVDRGSMPPWKPVAGFNKFMDDNSLSAAEIETLKVWDEAGAPRGKAAIEPKPPVIPTGWALGNPDLIASADREFKLEADGRDVYRNFVVKTDFKETKYVTGIDVKPGNSRVVHHVIAFIDTLGQATRLEAKTTDGQPGYSTFGGVGFLPTGSLGGWAPGLMPYKSDGDLAFELKPGATIVLQVHYHKSGKPETDLTKVGLYFAKSPPKNVLQLAWIANLGLRIPANASSHSATQNYRVPVDVTAYGAMPHMHLLGKSMKATVKLPDGTVKPLVWVENWDFKWQMQYRFQEPMKIPKGSIIQVEAVYDNSDKNPNQPNDPPKQVRWGEETTDEMMLLIVAFSIDAQAKG